MSTESLVVVAFVAVPVILLAFGSFVLTRSTAGKADDLLHKADVLIGKADEIHTLTNSNLTKVTIELNTANAKILEMQNLVATLLARDQERDTPTGK